MRNMLRYAPIIATILMSLPSCAGAIVNARLPIEHPDWRLVALWALDDSSHGNAATQIGPASSTSTCIDDVLSLADIDPNAADRAWALSADGRRIAFLQWQARRHIAYAATLDSRPPRLREIGDVIPKAWSRDGRWLAAVTDVGVVDRDVTPDRIVVEEFETGARREFPIPGLNPTETAIVFSSSGDELAYTGGRGELMILRVADGTTGPACSESIAADEYRPFLEWLPDGRLAVYSRETTVLSFFKPRGPVVAQVQFERNEAPVSLRPDGAAVVTISGSSPLWHVLFGSGPFKELVRYAIRDVPFTRSDVLFTTDGAGVIRFEWIRAPGLPPPAQSSR